MKIKGALLLLSFSVALLFSCKKNKVVSKTAIDKIQLLQKKAAKANTDSILFFTSQSQELLSAYKNVEDSLKAENNFLIGTYFDKVNTRDSAIQYYYKAIKYNIASANKIYSYYRSLMNVYFDKGDYINALNIADSLIRKLDTTKNFKQLGKAYNFKVMVYYSLNDFNKALFNNTESIKYLNKYNDTLALNTTINTRSRIFYGLHQKEKAVKILKDVLKDPHKLSNLNKYQSYTRLGIYYFYDMKYDAAKKAYLIALENAKKTNNKKTLPNTANCYNNLAEVCIKLDEFKLAKKYLDSTFLLDVNKLSEQHVSSALKYKLQLLYATKKDIEPILSYLDTVIKVNQDNYKQKMDADFLALKEAYKNKKIIEEQKQKTELSNNILKKNQLLLFLTIGVLLLSSFVGVLYYRQKKLKFSKDKLMLQQRLFRAQMNPHFTSNILFSIQNLFKQDAVLADKYLIKFSRLLRLNLENSVKNYVPIDKEVDAIKKYLELQKLRFSDAFEYQITGDCIDDELIKIPPMLMQPFVENTIEHGFQGINYKGILKIELTIKEQFVFCEITDNGIGIDNHATRKDKQSKSTKLIQELLKKLTKRDLNIINRGDISDATGVIIQFYIPFKKTIYG